MFPELAVCRVHAMWCKCTVCTQLPVGQDCLMLFTPESYEETYRKGHVPDKSRQGHILEKLYSSVP